MGFFMAYDVRGLYGSELTPEVAARIGESLAFLLSKKSKSRRTILVAMDNRSHSPKLKHPLVHSLLSSGFNVVDIGTVSTPVMQYALATTKGIAGGCIVTASHNPPEYNGFKMYLRDRPLYFEEMHALEKIYGSKKKPKLKPGKHGRESKKEVESAYVHDVLKRVKLARPLKVVIDSGNGTCGPAARRLFEGLGCRVTSLFEDLDSAFLNHAPDPSKPENLKWLQAEVVRQGADFGAAFDGDGDRCAFVDETGAPLRSDDSFALFVRSFGEKAKGQSFVFDLRFSKAVSEEIKKLKGKPVMSRVGRIAIRETMVKLKAVLGGEVSSHFFFADHFGFDDGKYAAAKMAELVSKSRAPLSVLVASIPRYRATPELRLHCDNSRKFQVVENVKLRLKKQYTVLTIDGIYLDLGDAWGALRVSNTEPCVTLRFEGKKLMDLQKVYAIFEKELALEKVKMPTLRSLNA